MSHTPHTDLIALLLHDPNLSDTLNRVARQPLPDPNMDEIQGQVQEVLGLRLDRYIQHPLRQVRRLLQTSAARRDEAEVLGRYIALHTRASRLARTATALLHRYAWARYTPGETLLVLQDARLAALCALHNRTRRAPWIDLLNDAEARLDACERRMTLPFDRAHLDYLRELERQNAARQTVDDRVPAWPTLAFAQSA